MKTRTPNMALNTQSAHSCCKPALLKSIILSLCFIQTYHIPCPPIHRRPPHVPNLCAGILFCHQCSGHSCLHLGNCHSSLQTTTDPCTTCSSFLYFPSKFIFSVSGQHSFPFTSQCFPLTIRFRRWGVPHLFLFTKIITHS